MKLQVQCYGEASPNNYPSRADMLIKYTLFKNKNENKKIKIKNYLYMGTIPGVVNGCRRLGKIEFNLSRKLFVTFFHSMPIGQ